MIKQARTHRVSTYSIVASREFRPCILALMRDPVTDAPVGIHRIGLIEVNGKIDRIKRMALGRMGVVKLWPLNRAEQLVAGEGIETVLAAATCVSYRGAPLTPAWSAIAKSGLSGLPVLPDVSQLVLLVDNDENGEGQTRLTRLRRSKGCSSTAFNWPAVNWLHPSTWPVVLD